MTKDFRFYLKQHILGFDFCLDNINNDKVLGLINLLQERHGKILFTGIGKNGHVAAKAASTFNSVGIESYFINPIDAVHGDMGLIKKDDIILTVSKSGNTEELIFFLKHAKDRTKNILLIHSNMENQILKYSSYDLFVPLISEADHLNKIPTTSIALYSVILQSMCCVLADENNFSLNDLVINHPGGAIGKTKV